MWAVKVCKAIDCLCYERAIHCWFKYKPYQRGQKFFVRRRPLNIFKLGFSLVCWSHSRFPRSISTSGIEGGWEDELR